MNILTTPPHWSYDAIFYHIYPLGFCGAPARNDFSSPPRRAWRSCTTGCHTCAIWASTPSTWARCSNPAPTATTPPTTTRSTAAWATTPHWRAWRTSCTARACAWCWTACSTMSGAISGPSATCSATALLHPTATGSAACASTGAAPTATRSPTRAGTGITTWCGSTWATRRCASTCSTPSAPGWRSSTSTACAWMWPSCSISISCALCTTSAAPCAPISG